MEIQRKDIGPRMTQIVTHGETIYLAGQVCDDVSQGIKEQTLSVLDKIDRLLSRTGSDKSKLLTAQIFLKDINDYDNMNEVWDDWVKEVDPPTRACVEAAMASPEYLVEIVVSAGK